MRNLDTAERVEAKARLRARSMHDVFPFGSDPRPARLPGAGSPATTASSCRLRPGRRPSAPRPDFCGANRARAAKLVAVRGCSSMARVPAFQAGYAGSIPVTRSRELPGQTPRTAPSSSSIRAPCKYRANSVGQQRSPVRSPVHRTAVLASTHRGRRSSNAPLAPTAVSGAGCVGSNPTEGAAGFPGGTGQTPWWGGRAV